MLRRTRNTYQNGWIETRPSKKQGLVFVYRWRERKPGGGYAKRTELIGPVSVLKTETNARRAVEHRRLEIKPFACALQLRHALGTRGHPRESHEAGAGARRKQAHEGAKGSDDRAISTTRSRAQRSIPHDGDPRSRNRASLQRALRAQ